MKIEKFTARNYRSLLNVTVEFPGFYSALCGRNDSGKTNILRAIRGILEEQSNYYDEIQDISFPEDLSKWKSRDSTDRAIEIEIELTVYKESDAGLHKFLTDYLKLELDADLRLNIKNRYSTEFPEGSVSLQIGGQQYETLQAQGAEEATIFQGSSLPQLNGAESRIAPQADWRIRW